MRTTKSQPDDDAVKSIMREWLAKIDGIEHPVSMDIMKANIRALVPLLPFEEQLLYRDRARGKCGFSKLKLRERKPRFIPKGGNTNPSWQKQRKEMLANARAKGMIP